MLRKLGGLVVGAAVLAFFWGMAWYVRDEGGMGMVAMGLFGLMGVGGAALGFLWVAFPERTQDSTAKPKPAPTVPLPGRFGRAVGRVAAAGMVGFGLLIGVGVIVDGIENGNPDNIFAGIAVMVCCSATGGVLWWEMNRRARLRARVQDDRLGAVQGVMMAHAMNIGDTTDDMTGDDGAADFD